MARDEADAMMRIQVNNSCSPPILVSPPGSTFAIISKSPVLERMRRTTGRFLSCLLHKHILPVNNNPGLGLRATTTSSTTTRQTTVPIASSRCSSYHSKTTRHIVKRRHLQTRRAYTNPSRIETVTTTGVLFESPMLHCTKQQGQRYGSNWPISCWPQPRPTSLIVFAGPLAYR